MLSAFCVFGYVLLICVLGLLSNDVAGDELYTRSACVNPNYCQTNIYSMECPTGQKMAVKGAYYGAKPYSLCPDSKESCSVKNRCCKYTKGDCREDYSMNDLFDISHQCTTHQQCGWHHASSVNLTGKCPIRRRSNYVVAEYNCIYDNSMIDVCSTLTRTSKVMYLHHSAFGPYGHIGSPCTCVISPVQCNTTATLQFRAIDVSLQTRQNISRCSDQSRVELVGQSERKVYSCEENEFLYGYKEFFNSKQNGMVLYLHKKYLEYPTTLLLEVQASIPNISVTVTCGPQSTTQAHKCPPLVLPDIIDTVDEIPKKPDVTPTIIHLDPDTVNDMADSNKGGSERAENPAMAAIIGGIVAGVVVLILLLIVLLIFIHRHRRNKEKGYVPPGGKGYLPKLEELENLQNTNYYESVQDAPEAQGHTAESGVKGRHIYHQPWGAESGIRFQDKEKKADLAYATSEEIKVLIEKMEKDRQFLNDGDEEEDDGKPDPVYYRHISNYRFKPSETESLSGDSEHEDVLEDDSETESKSNANENCETEKPESEDSKVEADRGVEDSDVESHKVDSDTVSAYFDGYESPRVSSFAPSEVSSVRDSVKSDLIQSDLGLPTFARKSENIIMENSHSDLDDVPAEHAPPVTESLKHTNCSQSDKPPSGGGGAEDDKGEVTLGAYRTPRGSIDGMDEPLIDIDENKAGSTRESSHYTEVYDFMKDKVESESTKL